MNAHGAALLDWLACAYGGREQRAARVARAAGDGLLERVAWLGTAGHVLDFDDTYLPGIAHLSAPTAPAAIAVAAELGLSVGHVLDAHAAGFEAMGRLSRAHRLYEGGWHPTAVCGAAGAARAAALLLELDEERTSAAERLALLQAGGLRAAFGSDGKSLQVGMAAAAGVQAARIAAGGAVISAGVLEAPDGFAATFGAARESDGGAAVEQNWIKPWPCCLMSHSAIEAATRADLGGGAPIEVAVHPVARRAAAYDEVADGLQAKFSIPYLVAYVALRGEPEPASFDGVDPEVQALARSRVRVVTDEALREAEAVIAVGREVVARVPAARGSPERPMSADELAAKCALLAGDRLDGLLEDRDAPAQALLDALA
ncbi:MAG TPA: MmgE/PrpD family protein [Solirubrobacteraceae bacterium]